MGKEEWTDDQFAVATAIVGDVENVTTAIQAVAADEDEVRWHSAITRLEDSLPLSVAKGLTPLQHEVAVINGRGVSFREIAERLNVEVNEIYQWHQQIETFRRAIDYYREMMQLEIEGNTLGLVDRLLQDESLDDKDKIGVARLGEKIGATPAERRDRDVGHRARLEQAAMTAAAISGVSVPARGLSSVRVVSMDDAEFEVVPSKLETEADDDDAQGDDE